MSLISENYRSQQQTLHEVGNYGVMGGMYAPIVAKIINKLEVTHLLDYGCGSNLSLSKGLVGKVNYAFKYQAYDPCVDKYASPPVPAELVCCVDVLEHIEEDSIDEVLDHLQSLTEAVGFFTFDTGPALKELPDGRNAHILQRPMEWWLAKICERFELQTLQVTAQDEKNTKFFMIVHARPQMIEDTDGSVIRGV